MPDKERKPRAPRKKKSAADASPAAAGAHDNDATVGNSVAAASTPADVASKQDQDDEQNRTPPASRATIDHMHEALQRPPTFGEVF